MIRYKVSKIFGLFEKYGNNIFIDNISHLQYMQNIAYLAEIDGFNDEIILSCFLLNIGYLICYETGENYKDFEKIGRDFLNNTGFKNLTCSIILNQNIINEYLDYKYNINNFKSHILEKKFMTIQTDPLLSIYTQISQYKKQIIQNNKFRPLSYYKRKCYDYLMAI